MLNTLITALIITGGIGIIAAALLVVASKLMHVEVDPKIAALREALPGANCGACGFSGCDGYADALAKGEVTADLCPPGGTDVYKKLSGILGGAVGDGPVKKIAIVRCVGDLDTVSDKMEYAGISTCYAAEQHYGGQGSCTFGCLRFGDCITACPVDAICMTSGIARIDTRKCGGCGLCIKACPRDIITMLPQPIHAAVLCQNTEKGAVVRNKCKKGCIACTKCVRECPSEAITITDSLAVIDNAKCKGCGHCYDICMTKCISAFALPPVDTVESA